MIIIFIVFKYGEKVQKYEETAKIAKLHKNFEKVVKVSKKFGWNGEKRKTTAKNAKLKQNSRFTKSGRKIKKIN